MTNDPQPLRFAVVGAGAISYAHFRAIQSLPGKAVLTAVADIRPEAVAQASEQYGIPGFPSLTALLQGIDVDVVCICTPPNVHGDLAIEAMGAGKDVIIEKPADVNVAATDRIIAASAETGRRASVISQHRFDDSIRVVKQAADAGRFGRLTRAAAQVRWWRPQEYFDILPWRASMAVTGGGALMSQSIHTLDLMLWVMGEVEEVFAYSATLAHTMEIEDTLSAVLTFRNGAIGVVEASIASYPGLSARLEVAGDRGSAIIDADHLTYFHAAEPGEETGLYGAFGDTNRANRELPATPTGDTHQDPSKLSSAHARQIEDFIDAIVKGRHYMNDIEEARKTMCVIEAIHRSVREHRPVRLAEVNA